MEIYSSDNVLITLKNVVTFRKESFLNVDLKNVLIIY